VNFPLHPTVVHGDYRRVLGNHLHTIVRAGLHCSVITDPPYGDATHAGRRTGSNVLTPDIPYAPLYKRDVGGVVRFVLDRCQPRFWVVFGDEHTVQWWKDALAWAGMYTFAVVPWCKPDAAPRAAADGPASATEHIAVAAAEWPEPPVEWISIARAPGWPVARYSRQPYYDDPTGSTRGKNGARGYPGKKPLALARKLVAAYAEAGDAVIDPFAGQGTILEAAVLEGCIPVGSEIAREPFEVAEAAVKSAATQTVIPVRAGRPRTKAMQRAEEPELVLREAT
jgi:hypothetical protein